MTDDALRDGYDRLASAYADQLWHELDGKPLDRWLLERVARAAVGPVLDVAHLVITMDGLTLAPPKMKVVVARAGDRLELTLFVPGFTSAEAMARPLYVVLDHAIGEYDLATKVGTVDFADLDDAPPSARSLLELPALFDQAIPPVN